MINDPERNPRDDSRAETGFHEVPEEQKKAYERMFGRPWYPGAERFVDNPDLEVLRHSISEPIPRSLIDPTAEYKPRNHSEIRSFDNASDKSLHNSGL